MQKIPKGRLVKVFNRQKKVRLNKKNITALAEKILGFLKKSGYSLNLIFVDKKTIQGINKKYRRLNRPTDVISFSLYNDRECRRLRMLGDIFICPEVAKHNAKSFVNTLTEEIELYITHGILHLLGQRDYTRNEYLKMKQLQERILKAVHEKS